MMALRVLPIAAVLALAVTLPASLAAPADFHAAYLDQSPFPTLAAGDTTTYTVRFHNTGTAAWQRGTASQANLGVARDATTFLDLGVAANWLSANRVATTVEDVVAPGGIATFTFTLRAPSVPGTYLIPLRPVLDGVTWLEDYGVYLLLVSSSGFHSQWLTQSDNPTLKPGGMTAPLTVTFKNTGTRAWARGVVGAQLNLGVVGDDTSWGGYGVGWLAANRVATISEQYVPPGATGTFSFSLKAPVVPGAYTLRLRPVVDGVAWLEDEGVYMQITVVPDPNGKTPTLTDSVVQSGLAIPWDVAFAPDGRMFVTELSGRLRIYASGAAGAGLLSTTAIADVHASGEAGLMGVALDPSFATNGFVYLCASRDDNGWVNQVLRYRIDATGALGFDGYVIRTGMYAGDNHDGCRIRFGPDGKLWVTMGEVGNPMFAQNPGALNGKILRVNWDGSTPADNPIMPGQTARTAVYTMGHRNPQGIAFEPVSGAAFAIEHAHYVDHTTGVASHATVMRLTPGANYSWPYGSGLGYAAPVWQSRNSPYVATSGGSFVGDAKWGTWRGELFLAALAGEMLLRLQPVGDGTLSLADTLYIGKYGRLRAVAEGPDGALYLTTSNGSNDKVIRVSP